MIFIFIIFIIVYKNYKLIKKATTIAEMEIVNYAILLAKSVMVHYLITALSVMKDIF